MLLPYATEEESTGSLKRIQERFEERWELGAVGSYIQAYFTDVMYRGQEWNATQIMRISGNRAFTMPKRNREPEAV